MEDRMIGWHSILPEFSIIILWTFILKQASQVEGRLALAGFINSAVTK